MEGRAKWKRKGKKGKGDGLGEGAHGGGEKATDSIHMASRRQIIACL